MGVDRWQAIALQLLADNVNESLHASVIVAPVADDLQTVREVAVGVGKVGLELERRAIRLDGVRYVAGILVDRRQITVGVGEGRIDLNGARVALQGTAYVLHLFQRVTHVGICVSERWLDPKKKKKIRASFIDLFLLFSLFLTCTKKFLSSISDGLWPPGST